MMGLRPRQSLVKVGSTGVCNVGSAVERGV